MLSFCLQEEAAFVIIALLRRLGPHIAVEHMAQGRVVGAVGFVHKGHAAGGETLRQTPLRRRPGQIILIGGHYKSPGKALVDIGDGVDQIQLLRAAMVGQ